MATLDQGLPAPVMNWDAEDQQISFQEFWDMAKLYLEVKGMEREVMWKHIILLLVQEHMVRWNPSGLQRVTKGKFLLCGTNFSVPFNPAFSGTISKKHIPHLIKRNRRPWTS